MLHFIKRNDFINHIVIKFSKRLVLLIPFILFVLVGCNNRVNEVFHSDAQEEEVAESVRFITGEDNIRAYLAEKGEPYDPTIRSITIQIGNKPLPHPSENKPSSARYGVWDGWRNNLSYSVRYQNSYRLTDFNNILKMYKFPKGSSTITETISVSREFSTEGSVSVEILEAKLGYCVTGSVSVSASWTGTRDYPVIIEIFPIYNNTTGSVFEYNGESDRYIGSFHIKEAIGTKIREHENLYY